MNEYIESYLNDIRSRLISGESVTLPGIGELVPYERNLPQSFKNTPKSKIMLKFINDRSIIADMNK